ncbi:hypothetical protein [Caballeronia telluris]|uniref:Uncharacterized protein n=1 Tax=Caballeronia telluris TaxID=326475 RepID=A0A158HG43_9BURK|nr:hypothetical protein [Caballeronia telluris]SAL43013.1 hypothetical protein AWB66_02275 [Caballeronia telluris]
MKEPGNQDIGRCAYFKETPVFVLVRSREDGSLDTAASMTAGGRAVVCHLSFVHALIDLAYRSSQGMQYFVREANSVDPDVFANAEGSGLIAQLRLAWPAKNRKIVLAQGRNTATCARLLYHGTSTGFPARFEVDDEAMEQVDRLHERAGLFAWRDTYRELLQWPFERQKRTLECALKSMETAEARLMECREAALFDPEFGQWHFVSLEGL